MYMKSQSTRQGKSKQLRPKTTPFSQEKNGAASGRIRTCNILCTRQTLYQLSHRGSSAGQVESLKVMQCKGRLSPDEQGNSNSVLCSCVHVHVHVHYQGFYMLQNFALFPSTFELLFMPMGNLETFVDYLIV